MYKGQTSLIFDVQAVLQYYHWTCKLVVPTFMSPQTIGLPVHSWQLIEL